MPYCQYCFMGCHVTCHVAYGVYLLSLREPKTEKTVTERNQPKKSQNLLRPYCEAFFSVQNE